MTLTKQIAGLLFFLAITFAAAATGSAATSTSVGDWYQTIAKPAWTPPSWVFGPVWTLLFLLMAIAAWLVWRNEGTRAAATPLALYFTQLALNTLWSVLFFGLRQPSWAAVEIVILWLAIAATLGAFWRKQPIAGMMIVPYLAWVTFAAGLNFAIASLNV